MRKIKRIHQAEYSKIDDLITYRALPTSSVDIDQIDPFLFLNHHGPQIYKPNNNGLPFGPHPHKGFETVTFILEGDILHKDTGGHESVIKEGGIQWMTAGKGIIHSEISSKEFMSKGGKLEILQLWINLPSDLKNANPNYIGLQKKDIPQLSFDQGNVTINLISGDWGNLKGPVSSLTGVVMTTIAFKKGGKLKASVDTSRTVFFYIVKGALVINGTNTKGLDLVEFENNAPEIEIEALEDSLILFGHAKPTDEPIVAHGPFVMNSMDEIRQAYHEYQEGKFGIWK